MSAAHALRRSGHDVTVLEASGRPGGRVWTLRSELGDGLAAEAGAARFTSAHKPTMEWVRRYKLATVPRYPERGSLFEQRSGQVVTRQLGTTLRPREVHRFLTGDDGGPWLALRDGADLLPRALAAAVEPGVRYNSPAQGVEQRKGRVLVTFEHAGTRHRAEADFAVCAIPFPALRRLAFDPPLTAAKRRVVDTLPYESAIRTFLVVRETPWTERGASGFGVSDELGEIWAMPGVIVCYQHGDLARRFRPLNVAERLAFALERLEPVLPGIGRHYVRGTSVSWDDEPWALGAQSRVWDLPPAARPDIARREGRMHFAGEHAGAPKWLGWMAAALESGERVARDIDAVARTEGTGVS